MWYCDWKKYHNKNMLYPLIRLILTQWYGTSLCFVHDPHLYQAASVVTDLVDGGHFEAP